MQSANGKLVARRGRKTSGPRGGQRGCRGRGARTVRRRASGTRSAKIACGAIGARWRRTTSVAREADQVMYEPSSAECIGTGRGRSVSCTRCVVLGPPRWSRACRRPASRAQAPAGGPMASARRRRTSRCARLPAPTSGCPTPAATSCFSASGQAGAVAAEPTRTSGATAQRDVRSAGLVVIGVSLDDDQVPRRPRLRLPTAAPCRRCSMRRRTSPEAYRVNDVPLTVLDRSRRDHALHPWRVHAARRR